MTIGYLQSLLPWRETFTYFALGFITGIVATLLAYVAADVILSHHGDQIDRFLEYYFGPQLESVSGFLDLYLGTDRKKDSTKVKDNVVDFDEKGDEAKEQEKVQIE